MIEFRGAITEQAGDVFVNEETGELSVTLNGQVLVRLALPPRAWAELCLMAARAAKRKVGAA